tara:strand:- start:6264 stop:6554 length:291 start_codon:yes stop_codon:yes gene_type:complete
MIVKQNYPESISRFMSWAEERLEKEVESIKRLEKQIGEELYEEKIKTSTKLTADEKRSILDDVEKAREGGEVSIPKACEKVGIHFVTYYRWKKKLT